MTFKIINWISHIQLVVGYTEIYWIPQIPSPPSTAAILIYPWSPQLAPHEFLTMQQFNPEAESNPYPTAVMAWSRQVPHASESKIPD